MRFMMLFLLLLMPWTSSLAEFKTSGGFQLSAQGRFLKPSEAFRAKAQKKGDHIEASVMLGEKIHIYAKDLHFRIVEPEKFELKVAMPKPVKYEKYDVYYGTLHFDIPLEDIRKKLSGRAFTLQIDMTGCSDSGICYQPRNFRFDFPASENMENKAPEKGFFSRISDLASGGSSAKIARALANEGVAFVILLFFVAGLLLALTPCILPMIPILSSIILHQNARGEKPTRSAAFVISLVYVLSMAAAYALIGVIAGLLGFDLQAHMNNPWIIIPVSALFVALALSLFGYFDLALPSSWQQKLTGISDEAKGKGLLGTAVMGSLSALIVGTCTAPVISGAIVFISMTGNALLGGVSLFVMGIGAGMPLLMLGAGADRLVPKPGGWMTRVSQIFGTAMLAMSIYILRGILPPQWIMLLFSSLLIGSALYMGVFDGSQRYKGAAKLFQFLAFLMLLYGSAIFTGALAGADSILDPLKPFRPAQRSGAATVTKSDSTDYTLARLQKEIAGANRPVIVDISKKNCAACSELEHITFADAEVAKELKRFKLIHIDITDNTAQQREIMKHYGVFGAPNLLFFDSGGKALRDKFLTGFIPPEKFLKHIDGIR